MKGKSQAPLFGFHLEGGAVSSQGVRIGFLADFLDTFRKLFSPLQVIPTGHIPQGNRVPATTALPPNVLALSATHSVTIYFSLDPEEWQLVAEKRQAAPETLLTYRAVGHLGALLSVEPKGKELLRAVEPFGRRVGRSYGQLADLLATSHVDADWWSGLYQGGSVEIPESRSGVVAEQLLHKEVPKRRTFKTGGFLSDAGTASDRRFVRIATDKQTIRATYDIPLVTDVTRALAHLVRVQLRETSYRFPFAEEPHRREYELLKILEVGDAAGALAEAAQTKLT